MPSNNPFSMNGIGFLGADQSKRRKLLKLFFKREPI